MHCVRNKSPAGRCCVNISYEGRDRLRWGSSGSGSPQIEMTDAGNATCKEDVNQADKEIKKRYYSWILSKF